MNHQKIFLQINILKHKTFQIMEQGKVYCAEVILCSIERRGDGIDTPIRTITQVFEKSGSLIAEYDPLPNNQFDRKDLLDFLKFVHRRHQTIILDSDADALVNTFILNR